MTQIPGRAAIVTAERQRAQTSHLAGSRDSEGMTGRRLVATKYRTDQGGKEAAEAAITAGWQDHGGTKRDRSDKRGK